MDEIPACAGTLDVLMYDRYTPRISPRFLITRLKIKTLLEIAEDGWGTRIRTLAAGVRVQSSTAKLSPTNEQYPNEK